MIRTVLVFLILLMRIGICQSQSSVPSIKKPDLEFKHIDASKGLSNSNIICITQDHQGFMWFGTSDGLNKYDGYSMSVYQHSPSDTTTLLSSDIRSLYEDSHNILWIGTGLGLNRYDRDNNTFIHHEEVVGPVSHMLEDNQQNLWLTSGPHIFLFDREDNVFKQRDYTWRGEDIKDIYIDSRDSMWVAMDDAVYLYNRKLQSYIPRIWNDTTEVIIPLPAIKLGNITAIFEDSENNFWLASMNSGLYLYDRDKKTVIKNYRNDRHKPGSIAGNTVFSIAEDREGKLWTGTQSQGLSILNRSGTGFFNYSSNALDPKSLSFNTVNVIYTDRQGHMWLGTHDGGVNLAVERKFRHYYVKSIEKRGLSNNNISAFTEDNQGRIWIGTDGGGINIFDHRAGTFKYLAADKGFPRLGANVVTSMSHSSGNSIWLGYWNGGIDKLNYATGHVKKYRFRKKDSTGIPNNNILYLFEDSKANLWVTTLNKFGILHENTGTFEHIDLSWGLHNYVVSILEDENDLYWLGTWNGLKLYDKKAGNYESFMHDANDPGSLSNDKVFFIHRDLKNRMWIGTAGGLNLFDPQTKTFKRFGISDGLPSEAIYAVLEDDKNHLWLSTGNGVAKFNPEKNSFKNYTVEDGLQSNEFKPNTALKLSTGEMIFGGNSGFNLFMPENIKGYSFAPPVVFTEFRIFNQKVSAGDFHMALSEHISVADTVTLSHNQSVFSIEFAALSYQSPEKNQYAYILEGFDREWTHAGNRRVTTYTNLDPGIYVFRVKASNNDGVWNDEGKALTIRILPPFWLTWWFRIVAFLSVLVVILAAYKIRVAVVNRQKVMLEEKVKEQTALIAHANTELRKRTEELESQAENLVLANREIEDRNAKLQTLHGEMKESLRAAQTIQQFLLPSEELIKRFLPESFIFHKPKDEVSGDFYWFSESEGNIIIAAVDCTGHGVSGALISVNGHHLIDRAIKRAETMSAAEILNKLDQEIWQLNLENAAFDAVNLEMDISLCVINKSKNQLQYAGANNPLYIIRNEELIETKANMQPVGFVLNSHLSNFQNHTINIETGDVVYLFSDGFADQIGGKSGTEKFLYMRFRQLLLNISKSALDQQPALLKDALSLWKNQCDQLDDILIIGFKL